MVLNCNLFYPYYVGVVLVFAGLVLLKLGYFKGKAQKSGALLVISGGALNLVERILTGCVRDYFDFFGLFHFNLFDTLVTLGTFLLLYGLWKTKK